MPHIEMIDIDAKTYLIVQVCIVAQKVLRSKTL